MEKFHGLPHERVSGPVDEGVPGLCHSAVSGGVLVIQKRKFKFC